jgi:ATP synthase protein I
MKNETRETLRELGYYSSLGLSVAVSIFAGLFIGLWLDGVFNTAPVMMFIFLCFGIIAGFNNIYRILKRSRKI